MKSSTLTPIRPEDAPFLTQLMNHPALRVRLHQPHATLADWQEAIEIWNADPDEEGFILRIGTTPVGWFAINGLCTALPYLKIAVLLPEYQGQCLGSFAIRNLAHQLTSRGYATLRLFADTDNLPALRCYKTLGFQILTEVPQTWDDGTESRQYEMEMTL